MWRMTPRFTPGHGLREILAAPIPRRNALTHYEKAFAETFGREYGVMFNFGRSGLYALLKVWGFEKAEVICPAYTCVVVAHAVVLSGNIPVFVDCEDDGFNMSPRGIREAITEKTRGVIVTHLFGYPMNIDAVEETIREAERRYGHKIYIIQDCAHSFGSSWKGRLTTAAGDAAIFGLNISKTIHSIFGGMVIMGDRELYHRLLEFRGSFRKPWFGKSVAYFFYLVGSWLAFSRLWYPMVYRWQRSGFLDLFVKYYDEGKIDFPSGWDEKPCSIQARVGIGQLRRYEEFIGERVAFAGKLNGWLEGVPGVTPPPLAEGATYSHFPVIVDSREFWLNAFKEAGVELGTIIDYSIPEMTAYNFYKRGEYPNALKYSKNIINIPLGLTASDFIVTGMVKEGGVLAVVGNDKTGRRLFRRLMNENLPELYIVRDKSRSWRRIFTILKKGRLELRVLVKMAWAEFRRKGEKTVPAPFIRSNRDLLDFIRLWKVRKVYLFRAALIISQKTLDSGVEVYNVHNADLPRYGGLGAIDRALRDGVCDQNACLFKVDRSIDGGAVIAKKPFRLSPGASYRENEDISSETGAELLIHWIKTDLGKTR